MPQTKTIQVWPYAELLKDESYSSTARERATQTLREWATMDDWHEYTLDTWKQALASIGFESPEIEFSGFCSQGDGASFTAGIDAKLLLEFMSSVIEPRDCIDASADGKGEDFRAYLCHKTTFRGNPEWAALLPYVDDFDGINIERLGHRYSHGHTCALNAADFDLSDHEGTPLSTDATAKLKALHDDWLDSLERFRLDLCTAIYRLLEEEYEYLQSEEVLIENAEANLYLFDEQGRPA